MKIKTFFLFFALAICYSLLITSCKHDIINIDDDMMPIDTMLVDTMGNDVPCDPDIVYFETDILPLLNSSCAFSGCHDAASAEDGVVLETYETVIATADVEPFNLEDSEIYEVLVDDDIDERMPPSSTSPLDQNQIELIALWILQGAENLFCDPELEPCDTEAVSYSTTVEPIISLHCVGCHSGNPPAGGIDLSSYTGVKEVADLGSLVGTISWDAAFSNMPQNADQLPTCEIDQIKSWVEDGALNN